MQELTYTFTKIFTRDKDGELIEKRVKAANVCPGLWITPEKSGMVDLIIDYNGIKWREAETYAAGVDKVCMRIPGLLKSISEGSLLVLNDYHKEMHRRIFDPGAPAIMELKKPEPKKPLLPDGTIRAKVLQYKADGNTLTEKWETLTKFAEGIYYRTESDEYGQNLAYIIYELKGLFWYSMHCERLEQIERYRERIIENHTNFETSILAAAKASKFIGMLNIEVMRRLGHDVAPLLASREACLKQRDEEDRKRIEERRRREAERQEVEERRLAELLADGKQKLLAYKCISSAQLLLIAESVGVNIHPRTLGTIRKKVADVCLHKDGTVTVWRSGNASIDGTAQVVFDVAQKLREQNEEKAEQPTTPAETPQVCAESSNVENTPAEDKGTQETAHNAAQSSETPPVKDLSTESENQQRIADQQQNHAHQTLQKIGSPQASAKAPLSPARESSCRIVSILSEAESVLNGDCDAKIVPQIFSEAGTANAPPIGGLQ